MSTSVEASAAPVAADDYQLIQPPLQLDPRILVGLARLIMDGRVTQKSHTAALMSLTVVAWALDRFLTDSPGTAPVPGPITGSVGVGLDQPEAGPLLHAAACLSVDHGMVEGAVPGVQEALPPVDWAKVIRVLILVLGQVAPLLGQAV